MLIILNFTKREASLMRICSKVSSSWFGASFIRFRCLVLKGSGEKGVLLGQLSLPPSVIALPSRGIGGVLSAPIGARFSVTQSGAAV